MRLALIKHPLWGKLESLGGNIEIGIFADLEFSKNIILPELMIVTSIIDSNKDIINTQVVSQ